MSIDKKRSTLRWTGFIETLLNPALAEGFTPRKAIWKKNKAALWYYPAPKKKYRIPIFLIYSLINQPAILDLAPNISLIEALGKNGYDVFLLDFGIPGYEDKDTGLDDYIYQYIHKGVKQALRHSQAEAISVMGFCLGGTITAVYAAVANEPIKNVILSGAPIDFRIYSSFDKWGDALSQDKIEFNTLIDTIGLIPAPSMEAGMRLLTSPVYFSPYLSLLNRAYDKDYRSKWSRMNSWTRGHIPLPGKVLKQILQDLVKENNLISGKLVINEKKVKLKNIKANLLVVTSDSDQLVPKEQVTPIIDHVSSKDKKFWLEPGGHANLAKKGELPNYLKNWLSKRSSPI